MADELDRTTLARAILATIRIRTLTDMLRNRRVWREQVFRGFRPDSITRSVANGAATRFATSPAALAELLSIYINDLGYEDFSDGLIAAASDPRVPQETQIILQLASETSDLSQLPVSPAAVRQSPAPETPAVENQIAVEPSGTESWRSGERPLLTSEEPARHASAEEAEPDAPRFTWSPPQDEVGEIQTAATIFERCLAAFIIWVLEDLYGDAWLRKGCGPWRKDWQQRAKEKEGRTGAVEPRTLLGYASLSQLKEIIVMRDNWMAFERHLRPKQWFESEFNNLPVVRDAGAHAADRTLYKAEQVQFFKSMCAITDRYHPETAREIDRMWSQESKTGDADDSDEVLATLFRVEKNFDSLPRVELIGRENEITRLHEFWDDEFERSICVTGRGGVGKTTLVHSFVNELLSRPCKDNERPHPELVLALTAKNNWLSGQVQSPVEQRFGSLRRVLEAFIDLCGGSTSQERGTEELRDEALAQARDMPCLIFLDNLETLPDEELERIGTFVRRLPAPSKVILTDRERRAFGERLDLSGLEASAATGLVRFSAAREGVEIPRTQDRAIARVSEELNGVPLYLQFFANLLVNGYSASEALQKIRGRDMLWLLRFSFESSVKALSEDARELLYYLAHMPDPVARENLRNVVRDGERIDDAIRRLRNAHFIENVEMGSFRITDPQLREYVITEFPLASWITDGAASRISYLADAPVQSHPNIERSIQQLIQEAKELGQSDWKQAYDRLQEGRAEFGDRPEIIAEIGYFAYRLRRRDEARQLLESAIRSGYQDADKHRTLGLVYYYENRFDETIRQAETSLTLWPDEPRSLLLLGDALIRKAERSTLALDEARRLELTQAAKSAIQNSLIEDDFARWQRDHNERRARLLERAEALEKRLSPVV